MRLTTVNSQHRRNGRESISSLRRREFRVRVRRKLTLRSVASVQGVHLNAGEKARIADSNSKNAVSFSSARTTKRFPSSRCAPAIQIVRPTPIHAYDAAPTASGFAQIVSDYFPILHPVPGNHTHDYVGRFEMRIRVRERQATLDLALSGQTPAFQIANVAMPSEAGREERRAMHDKLDEIARRLADAQTLSE